MYWKLLTSEANFTYTNTIKVVLQKCPRQLWQRANSVGADIQILYPSSAVSVYNPSAATKM